jgi:hypothetical protein
MAASIVSPAAHVTQGDLSVVDTVQKNPIGMIAQGYDALGNSAEFIYLKGVASTIVGSVVTYDEAGVTALLAAGAIGPVAVALAINVAATTFSWYGITGTFPTDVVANCADNANLGRETTNGKVGDGFASGDAITGAVSRAATTAAAVINCQFQRPSVNAKSA